MHPHAGQVNVFRTLEKRPEKGRVPFDDELDCTPPRSEEKPNPVDVVYFT